MKRLCPKTGKAFKRWDLNDRGYVFWTYQKTIIKKDGFFTEIWLDPDKVNHLRPKPKKIKVSKPIKRINPHTKKPYRRWDPHPELEGKVFWGYKTTSSDENGYCQERWKHLLDVSHLNPFGRLPEVENPKKGINPDTGDVYERWDVRNDGKIFWRFRDKVNKRTGYLLEDWRLVEKLPYPKPQEPNPILENPPRRINPETGNEFCRWDRDPHTGSIFWNYDSSKPVNNDGLCREFWRNPDNLPYPEPEEPEITYLKQCSHCLEWKIRQVDFYKYERSYDGRASCCKPCKNSLTKEYYSENREQHNEWTRNYYLQNKEEISEKFRKRYSEDPSYRKQRLVQFYIREERTRTATPNWVKKSDLLPFYEESQRLTEQTGILHHVDHIIPIKHDLVCGLNCPSNLQIITAEENLRKSNKFEVT
jgi:hypothetical protein